MPGAIKPLNVFDMSDILALITYLKFSIGQILFSQVCLFAILQEIKARIKERRTQ
jgi:hypothetical protein